MSAGAAPGQASTPAADTPVNSAAAPRAFLRKPIVTGLCLAVLIALGSLSILTVPPAAPTTEADPSLSAVLSYVQAQHLQFGKDVVSTYGPLGFLIFPYYEPLQAHARLISDVAVCTIVASGIWLLAFRAGRFCGTILALLFLWSAANIYPRTDLIPNAGLLCWTVLCLSENGHRLILYVAVLTAFAAFAALAKVYYFFTGSFVLCLVAGRLALGLQGAWTTVRTKPGVAHITLKSVCTGLLLLAVYALLLTIGWILSGQQLSNLAVWLKNAYLVISSYPQALGWEDSPGVTEVGFTILWPVTLGLLLKFLTLWRFRASPGFLQFSAAYVALVCFALLSWKHGFVRGDMVHAPLYLGLVPVLMLGLAALHFDSIIDRIFLKPFTIVVALLSVWLLQDHFLLSLSQTLPQPLRNISTNAAIIANRAQYDEKMRNGIELCRVKAELPELKARVGTNSVDAFGQRQADLLLNGMNYAPRPVFQSYNACTAPLMRLNERFYLSAKAPEFVLFELDPLDRKLPALEDAYALRAILINYHYIASEGRYVVLKKSSVEQPRVRLLKDGVTGPGGRIELSVLPNTNLWIEIDLPPSLKGTIRQFLFQPPVVRLAIWDSSRKLICRLRAPACMLEAGFLASPLLLETADIKNWTEGKELRVPAAYSVELQRGTESFWDPRITYRIYSVENALTALGQR